jgi:hypothetical protein
MPRYLVIKHRSGADAAPSSSEVLADQPDVKVLQATNPNMVLIEASEATAARLQQSLAKTHYIEQEIRHGLH